MIDMDAITPDRYASPGACTPTTSRLSAATRKPREEGADPPRPFVSPRPSFGSPFRSAAEAAAAFPQEQPPKTPDWLKDIFGDTPPAEAREAGPAPPHGGHREVRRSASGRQSFGLVRSLRTLFHRVNSHDQASDVEIGDDAAGPPAGMHAAMETNGEKVAENAEAVVAHLPRDDEEEDPLANRH